MQTVQFDAVLSHHSEQLLNECLCRSDVESEEMVKRNMRQVEVAEAARRAAEANAAEATDAVKNMLRMLQAAEGRVEELEDTLVQRCVS
eukprot:SAG31_NODE_2934_length_4895_cov_688.829195_3_plen_89_part_00